MSIEIELLDGEALILRPVLLRPPWTEDARILAMFRAYRPAPAPHVVPAALREIVRNSLTVPRENVNEQTVDHAALLLHLAARTRSERPREFDFGDACRRGGVSDLEFVRMLSTPRHLRLPILSRILTRISWMRIHWASPYERLRSRSSNASERSTDEVWPALNFLFGEDPTVTFIRWANGFYQTGSIMAEALRE